MPGFSVFLNRFIIKLPTYNVRGQVRWTTSEKGVVSRPGNDKRMWKLFPWEPVRGQLVKGKALGSRIDFVRQVWSDQDSLARPRLWRLQRLQSANGNLSPRVQLFKKLSPKINILQSAKCLLRPHLKPRYWNKSWSLGRWPESSGHVQKLVPSPFQIWSTIFQAWLPFGAIYGDLPE